MKISIVAAITADGFIGRHAEHLVDWSSPEDKKFFTKITKEAGTIVMGSRTFSTINRALPGRRSIVLTSHPETINASGVEATDEPLKELVERLTSEGATGLAVCGGATVYSQFMESGLVTDMYLTIEPLLFGSGVPLFAGRLEVDMQLAEILKLNDNTILLHYRIPS
nr:Dihydrofolate reductase [uncultured bacterium]